MRGSFAMIELELSISSFQGYFFVKTSYWLFFKKIIFLFYYLLGNAISEGFRVLIPP